MAYKDTEDRKEPTFKTSKKSCRPGKNIYLFSENQEGKLQIEAIILK